VVLIVRILQGVFIAGVVGCCLTIPLCAWKFFSVLFEGKTEEENREASSDVSGQV
jgi:hypothetical protein